MDNEVYVLDLSVDFETLIEVTGSGPIISDGPSATSGD